MAHSKLYAQLLNCKQWRTLRGQYLTQHPLCERCQLDGYIKAAQAVHHIVPVETGKDEDECRQLCYDWNNLQALCYKCHSEIHKDELHSYVPSVHKERQSKRMDQWIARLKSKHKAHQQQSEQDKGESKTSNDVKK